MKRALQWTISAAAALASVIGMTALILITDPKVSLPENIAKVVQAAGTAAIFAGVLAFLTYAFRQLFFRNC
jgi:hypothetical protein